MSIAILSTYLLLSILPKIATATLCTKDPGDYACLSCDAADNAILADYKDAPFASTLSKALASAYEFSGAGKDVRLSHATYSVDKNDTSVLVSNDKAVVHGSYLKVIKEGYSSDLIQASFFGVNAAINAQNASKMYLDHVNITVHNGAAGAFAYGTDTEVHISDSTIYASGPVSHGLYASGNGTIRGTDVAIYTGGNRCSGISGDNPAGYVYLKDSVIHTAGVGSAVAYALGLINADNVLGLAENAPALFMDSKQTAIFTNCDLTAGLLAGMIIFGSRDRETATGGVVKMTDSRLTTSKAGMPAFWFGNSDASLTLRAVEVNTISNVLVVANYSQVTQDFDYFAGYTDNPFLSPAIATVNVAESQLTGDLVAYNSSLISFTLSSHSSWTGAAYPGFGKGYFAVSLDSSSTWILTKDTYLQNFTNTDRKMSNIISNGHSIYYDKTSKANAYLNGKSISLNGGGSVKPL